MILLLISCGAGWSDIIIDLENGYFYNGEGTPVNYIFYGKKNQDKSWNIDKRIVYPNVSDYDYNKQHIIVLQNPNHRAIINTIISGPFYSEGERKLAEKKADSILKNDPYYKKLFSRKTNYWIISKKDHQVYGPYSKPEYEAKRKELKVSKKLILKETIE